VNEIVLWLLNRASGCSNGSFNRSAQKTASVKPHSLTRRRKVISPDDAALLIHKLITESKSGIVAFFVSSDGAVRSKITGKLSVLPGAGLAIVSGPDAASSLHLESAALQASAFEYDAARGQEGLQFESGLTIVLPSGARLTLLESKDIDSTS
jgi:hypothetical protein